MGKRKITCQISSDGQTYLTFNIERKYHTTFYYLDIVNVFRSHGSTLGNFITAMIDWYHDVICDEHSSPVSDLYLGYDGKVLKGYLKSIYKYVKEKEAARIAIEKKRQSKVMVKKKEKVIVILEKLIPTLKDLEAVDYGGLQSHVQEMLKKLKNN